MYSKSVLVIVLCRVRETCVNQIFIIPTYFSSMEFAKKVKVFHITRNMLTLTAFSYTSADWFHINFLDVSRTPLRDSEAESVEESLLHGLLPRNYKRSSGSKWNI